MIEPLETAYFIPNEDVNEAVKWAACLVVLQGDSIGNRFLLDKPEIVIGRSESADVCLSQDEGVSRMHAVIQHIEGTDEFVLVDKDSRNGTFVNAKEIKIATLADQDIIKISDHVLKFISSTSPEQAHYDELYRQTYTDKALQIYDKRYFLTKLSEELNHCQRYNTELSLVLFDVDHFKKVNDNYGHLTGDAALIQLVEITKNRIRDTDIFCRYGGEEFAIIMQGVGSQQAYILAEHLRSLVAKKPLNYSNVTLSFTISLGIASYQAKNSDTWTRDSLIALADKALYQAKQTGRNKVVLSDSGL
jgi:diguanylate cyclase (GGDEF)-like protein